MAVLLSLMACWPGHAAELLCTLHPDRVLRDGADRVIGINLNYLRDADANRPADTRPLREALDELGVRWLRYPGGEKSDLHRFAPPPYDHPSPISLGWSADVPGKRLDFAAYIGLCRSRGAEPYVVVACDTPERSGRSWDEQCDHAVGWVRYARAHGCQVRHWEIGNENWQEWSAPASTLIAQVVRFARAMKAADPGIRVGTSGNTAGWWRDALRVAAPDLDFLTCSVYNCWDWRSYDRLLRTPEPDLLGDAGNALRAIAALPPGADRERLEVIVAETNSRDYTEHGWSHENSLGHAIVIFETLGAMLRERRIAAAQLWNTRWIDTGKALDDIFYALDDRNHLTASGLAVALWGRHLRSRLVAIDVPDGPVRAHASVGPDGSWTVWLVNRGHEPVSGVRLDQAGLAAPANAWRLTGTGVGDVHPTLSAIALPARTGDGPGRWSLPPLSITVIRSP